LDGIFEKTIFRTLSGGFEPPNLLLGKLLVWCTDESAVAYFFGPPCIHTSTFYHAYALYTLYKCEKFRSWSWFATFFCQKRL